MIICKGDIIMFKQTRFYLGLMLIVQAISCFFLAIFYLFKDKKNTARPFTLLGLISILGGAALVVERLRECFDERLIAEMESEACEACGNQNVELPIDDTADEEEFN